MWWQFGSPDNRGQELSTTFDGNSCAWLSSKRREATPDLASKHAGAGRFATGLLTLPSTRDFGGKGCEIPMKYQYHANFVVIP
ncbi:hypothetical protein [Pseudaminobacter salicylatoxidans]|uniref:hypothetical protein n=1 Tax=Pseudaminobacter salicylatoxidans TaxID=93369 RepID=UPI000D6C869F|nr:hypothetical protein [Pseudaminobacter salicylatoxidans]